MGKLIEQRLAPEYGFSVHARLDINDDLSKASGADVAVEFTLPAAVPTNVEALAALGIPVVVGTTGWLDHMDRVRAAIDRHHTALVWSPNFSIGVNVFLKVVHEAAKLLANEPAYGAWAWEIHHHTKKDAPSGTLLALVNEMPKKRPATRAISTPVRIAPARTPALTKSVSIPQPIPSRCATPPRAAAKVLLPRRAPKTAHGGFPESKAIIRV